MSIVMTATKGKVQGTQGSSSSTKILTQLSTFTMPKEERSESGYFQLFLIPKERGNNQEAAAGMCRVSQRGSTASTALPLAHT